MVPLKKLLKHMIEKDASDIYLTVGLPPMFRIEGIVNRYEGEAEVLTGEDTQEVAYGIMNERQKRRFEEEFEMGLALFYPDLGRFRVSIFRQMGHIGVIIRQIKIQIKTIDDLGLPQILKDIVMTKRGLVLLVGATGTGKSTTLAAMIDHRNENERGHIISVEDPIEFVHHHKKSIITQREIGFDTLSFANALKYTMRQAPDVILIGEIRDTETMEAAVGFAETGHLCLGTLHANNANQALERIMNFFPAEQHSQIFMQLSLTLRAIISQRLIPTLDGKRVAAIEILLDTPRVKDLIAQQDIPLLKEAMGLGYHEGMQTFDQSIFDLYMAGRIDYQHAIAYADSQNDVRLRIKTAEVKKDKVAEKGDMRLKLEWDGGRQ
ncbi:MAG: pilU [Deltaproteobacteria bacterium]|jgi:twitching motility protein PilU|nr:pilU [Deltaproteobacteria bacterium]